jgi:hypothetical protein
MEDFETHTHSFIVRVWLEETVEETGQALWRGHIRHVPSGERRYLKDTGDVADFIAPYLEGMGVKLDLATRIRQAWRCSKHTVRVFLGTRNA